MSTRYFPLMYSLIIWSLSLLSSIFNLISSNIERIFKERFIDVKTADVLSEEIKKRKNFFSKIFKLET